MFSYSGGFSVAAAQGGATRVVSVDISPHAIALGEANLALNHAQYPHCVHEHVKADAFVYLEEAASRARSNPNELYDVVITDPPSMARRKSDKGGALRAYQRLANVAVELVKPGGRLVCASCTAHVTKDEMVAAVEMGVGGRGTVVEVTGEAEDHPALFPEAHYLKCVFVDVPLN